MTQPLQKIWPIQGEVRIDDAFWNDKLCTYFQVTLPDTLDKLERDGVLTNINHVISGQTGEHKGPPWLFGLLMETMRGASDYLRRGERSDVITARLEGYAQLVDRAQSATGGGYMSPFTMLDRPNQRYGENGGNILWQHDLYNNGCLMEAGVHHYLGTGSLTLLRCAVRCANELSAIIGLPPKKWIVPGHELPSYALMELIELASDEPDLAARLGVPVRVEDWRALAHFWIHGRGHHEHRNNNPQYMGEYAQDHAPIQQQAQAVGHAVRATLYYTGVTRLAMLEGDVGLLTHSLRLWDNATLRKLHINGGVGATHFEEKFGNDYDLINNAYLETCASVGLVYWGLALNQATGEGDFFDVIERAMYNLLPSAVSLSGNMYFYRNPLQSDGSDHRWSWHGCPCCPPMLHKLFGMMDRLMTAQDDEGVVINLLIGGDICLPGAQLHAESDLPWQGAYRLRVTQASGALTVKIRVPGWAEGASFALNGKPVTPAVVNGYACFAASQGDEITFTDPMPVRRVQAHPYVRDDRGHVAIARGPLVYCLEGVDNRFGVDVTLPGDVRFSCEHRPDLLGGVTVIRGADANGDPFTAVPLYAWDNRAAGPMAVWLRQLNMPDTWSVSGWHRKLYKTYQ